MLSLLFWIGGGIVIFGLLMIAATVGLLWRLEGDQETPDYICNLVLGGWYVLFIGGVIFVIGLVMGCLG